MPKIKPAFLQRLKKEPGILAIAQCCAELKQRGSDWWGTCPLPGHTEKTPSFKVSPIHGNFRCFGCGKTGDAIELVMQVKNIGFQEAVEIAAKSAGLVIEYEDGPPAINHMQTLQIQTLRARLYKAHELAQAYFKEQINKPESKRIRDYVLKDRNFSLETAKTRGFGFAPSHDDGALLKHISEKLGLDATDNTGLFCKLCRRGNSDIRRLRWSGRLMIPLHDAQGRICAFTGRSIPSVPDETPQKDAKYINSPNTQIFSKGKFLFNWNEAWKALSGEGKGSNNRLILVEGQFDAIRIADTIGYKAVVAAQGSAITDRHIQLLASCPAGVLCLLDGDTPGINTALKLMPQALTRNLDIIYTILENNSDPDEAFKNTPPEIAGRIPAHIAGNALSPMQLAGRFMFPPEKERTTARTQAGLKKILQWLAATNNHSAAQGHIRELATLLNIDPDAIWADYKTSAGMPAMPLPPKP